MTEKETLIASATEKGIALDGTETIPVLKEKISKLTPPTPPIKQQAPSPEPMPTSDVSFSPEQIAIIQRMLEDAKVQNSSQSPNNPISVYNLRDPKSIETVNVGRFDGKFVMGFKNYNNDPFKKAPRWNFMAPDPIRKLASEPWVTLYLSDGTEENGQLVITERTLLLIDYLNERSKFVAPVVHIERKEVIHDHGLLGRNNMAIAVNSSGQPESRPTVKAQSKSVEMKFTVELPGFTKPVEFIPDFLG